MIFFRSRGYRRVQLKISPRVKFRKILELLEELVLPDTIYKADHIKYALLEMINNSLRAHRQYERPEPIEVALEVVNPYLRIVVRDWGPGFDPNSLPFSLDGDPRSIDLESDRFQEYRRLNGYQRFGMGLPLVMRTFDTFRLTFLDQAGCEIAWEAWNPQRVRGTLISVTKMLASRAADSCSQVQRPEGAAYG
jgi:anti-sigma regulatory factor (Ser/Thr protein kinase)